VVADRCVVAARVVATPNALVVPTADFQHVAVTQNVVIPHGAPAVRSAVIPCAVRGVS
jgi:hypothetical protein